MNYYGPRQRQSDMKWDYTCMNDGVVWPVGYCAGWKELTSDDVAAKWGPDYVKGFLQDQEKRREFISKYHAKGHDTEGAACECYRDFLLDQRMDMEGRIIDEQRKCQVCGKWTQAFAQIDHGAAIYLCADHLNKEEVARAFGPVREIISSY